MSHHMIIFIILDARCVVTVFCVYCLCNAIHCMGQNIKSLAGCFCVCLCVRTRVLGPNITKTVRDRGSVPIRH